ncbi:MAG: hypothetical protein ACM3VW_02595 [Bacteroidota bacterium]
MQARRPSRFFSRLELRQGDLDLQEQLLARHRARRAAALLATIAFLTLAVAGSIYLATPHEPGQWQLWRSHRGEPQIKTTTMTTEPGTVDLQIQQGRSKGQTYRFRKVGEDLVIQDVTPAKGNGNPAKR